MRSCLPTALLALALLTLACDSREPRPTAPSEDSLLLPLAPGVYAARQPNEKRFDDSNVVVIVGSAGVLIVDAPADESFVRRVCAEIRKRTDQPLRYVVNTHWHADHTQGNAVYRREFGDTIEFVGHETLLDDVPDRAEKDLRDRVARLETRIPEAERELETGKDSAGTEITPDERTRQRAAVERARGWLERNRDAEFLVPTRPFSGESTTLSLGDREVVLGHVRAHTRGDAIVYLPNERLLITGDVLDDLPFVGHGTLASGSRRCAIWRRSTSTSSSRGMGRSFSAPGSSATSSATSRTSWPRSARPSLPAARAKRLAPPST